MISKDTRALLAYGFLKGVGKTYLNELTTLTLRDGDSITSHFEFGKFSKGYFSEKETQEAFKLADQQIKITNSYGHVIISRLDEEYPDNLKAIKNPPPILFCSGNVKLLKKPVITIIGTRNPTKHGKLIAARVTNWFTKAGWVIASGLAKGIDTIAHSSCLESKGETVAVLAHGLEKIYPAENKYLAKEIVDSYGLLITEYKYNSYVGKSNFVERDKIQAAIAKAVFLVQSDVIGGSLHASRAALDYERYLIVVGQSTLDIKNNEAKIGANMLLLQGSINDKNKLLKTNIENMDKIIPLIDKSSFNDVNNKINQLKINTSYTTIGTSLNLF